MMLRCAILLAAVAATATTADAQRFTTIDVPVPATCQQVATLNPRADMGETYLDAGGRIHGYLLLRDRSFLIIDVPGSVETRVNGITPAGDVAGRYVTPDGISHGYLLTDGRFTTIVYPGAIFTGITGINARGDVVGRYQTADGRSHGFLLSRGVFT